MLCSCHSSKYTVDPANRYVKMNVEIISPDSDNKLSSIAFLSKDSSMVSVYGPLGISLLRVYSRFDSLIIVDIQNKKKYLAKIYNSSGSIYNFFNGKFGTNEKHIVCSLCSLFIRNLNCSNSGAMESMFDYRTFGKKNRQYINCKFYAREGDYTAKFKLRKDDNRNSVSFNLAKYSNFETVYLTLP